MDTLERLATRHLVVAAITVAAVGSSQAQAVGRSDRGATPAPTSWLATVGESIAREEYHLSPTCSGDALSAPNRAQGLRTTWQDGAVVVAPRTDEAAWSLRYELVGVGRAAVTLAMAPPRVDAESMVGNWIEWRREGGVRECYVNDARGIEQGFTLERRPEGDSAKPLVIAGRLVGLLAYPSEDRQSVLLRTPQGMDVLRIGELRATDARGVEIPARLAVTTGRLDIVVDDRGAAYPVTVDPLLAGPTWTTEGDQRNAFLGCSVATAGDVNGDGYADVIVGVEQDVAGPAEVGRALVFEGSRTGLSTTPAWRVDGDESAARFGSAVATAGDVNGDGYSDVIVGAPVYENGQRAEGRAYLYLGSPGGLASTPAWTAESDQADASFGTSVSTAGDVNGDGFADVIVGANGYDNTIADQGRAYVYEGSATGLSATAAWTAESDQGASWFGTAVATAGDINGDGYADVIVGAGQYDAGPGREGRAYVYTGSAAGTSPSPTWTAQGDQPGADFGWSVATAGDVNGDGYSDVIIGADGYDNGETDEGRVYVFEGSAAGLTATSAWTAESDQGAAYAGASAATAGDVDGDGFADVVFGAPYYDAGETDEGRVYVYRGSATGLGASPTWTAESDRASSNYGDSVATAGDVNGDGYSDVIVGAYTFTNDQVDEGRAYVYMGAAAGLAATAAWTAESDQADDFFAFSIASAGDVNGDGYSDVIVGACRFDNGETDEGRAFVYYGSAAGLDTTADWTAESDQADALFGGGVGSAGDANGDGYSDVIVGAHAWDNGEVNEGRALVYNGSASGLASTPDWAVESDQAGSYFGWSVATAGDVNGDGFSDVIVGAWAYANGEIDEGRAFVYLGSATGLGASAAWTTEGDQAGAQLGYQVASAGDVNGDGYSDVIVGAYTFTNDQVDEGRAFVHQGSAAGLGSTPAWTAEGDQASAWFGISVGTAGDVNGDGYSDVIVGAENYENGETREGRAAAYYGSATGLGTAAAWTAEIDRSGAFFGDSVGTAGDVNGDGYSDVIIGAWSQDGAGIAPGAAFVYNGSASGLGATAAWTATGDQPGALFGRPVSTAGDVNGDGYSDVIVGEIAYSNGETREGRVLVYYGNDGDGLDRIPRQRRADGSAPIDLLGLGDFANGFRIHARARSPFGRDDVRLEAEVQPLGTPFDGTSILTTPFTDTGAPGAVGSFADLDVLKAPLGHGPQHWRVRMRGTFPFPWQSHWMSLPYNCATETDLRVAGVNPVTCDAGAPQDAGCPGATVTLDGTASAGPPPLTYRWSSLAPGISIASPTSAITDVTVSGAGVFTVRLQVTSGADSASCTTTVTAGDVAPPGLTCPRPIAATPTQPAAAFVAIMATATDDCDPAVVVTNDRTAGGADASDVYPCGDTLVTFTATDATGNSSSCSLTVTVVDLVSALEVSSAGASVPLRVTKDVVAGEIDVSFEDCGAPNELFNLYGGTILPAGIVAYDHVPIACKVAASPVAPGVGELIASWDAGTSHYYLVSASNCAGESTRGFRSDGLERVALPTDCGGLP